MKTWIWKKISPMTRVSFRSIEAMVDNMLITFEDGMDVDQHGNGMNEGDNDQGKFRVRIARFYMPHNSKQ